MEKQTQYLIVRVAQVQKCLNAQPKDVCYIKVRDVVGKPEILTYGTWTSGWMSLRIWLFRSI